MWGFASPQREDGSHKGGHWAAASPHLLGEAGLRSQMDHRGPGPMTWSHEGHNRNKDGSPSDVIVWEFAMFKPNTTILGQ